MKQKWRRPIRQIICILLCIAMLPLVNVSAENYGSAYYTLVQWSRQGTVFKAQDPDVGEMMVSCQITGDENEQLEIYVQDIADPAFEDFMVADYFVTRSKLSNHRVIMFIDPVAYDRIYFTWMSDSENTATGAPDRFGHFNGEAYGYLKRDRSLDDGFVMYEYEAAVPEAKIKNDFMWNVRVLLEKLDILIRQQSGNLKLSVLDFFPNMSPTTYHNMGKGWISRAETCTADGVRTYQCANCGVVYEEPIPAHHNWTFTREEVPATDVHGTGLFTCTVCGQTKLDPLCIGSVFTDMPAYDNWAHAGIDWAVYNNITNGTSATAFSPGRDCTRAQVVTFLWRAAGMPEPDNVSTPFKDLQPGAYYEKAVAWAVENQITSGTSATTFSPDSTCTRGQIVTFLWRFKGMPEASGEQVRFMDVAPGMYYEKAVAWAAAGGVTAGTSRISFSPDSKCTRAQVVTFLYRAQGHALPPVEYRDLVGISMPTRDLQRWNQDGINMKKFLEDSGCEVDLQYAANDPSMQISQIENMIANGTQVLIVAAIDGDALDSVLSQAKQAGCFVIAYDRPIGSDAVSYYVSFDNFSVGAAQGRYIADKLDLEHAGSRVYNIELIGGDPSDGNAYVFYEGAMSVLRKYIDAGNLNVASGQYAHFEDVATDGWSSENAQARFENILSTYYTNQPLHAVLASNDSTAQGVTAALQKVYRNSVYPIITGQDCDIVSVRNILNGKQDMSVFKDTGVLVAKATEMALAILYGEPVPVNSSFTLDGFVVTPSFLCEPKICTKDNVRQLLVDTGYYTEAELSFGTGF